MESMTNENSEETATGVFRMALPDFANFERINAFENMTERGTATIYCIYGAYASGKASITSMMCCNRKDNEPVVLDGESMVYYVLNDVSRVVPEGQTEVAVRLAKLALYFAMQGRDVYLNCVKADDSYEYLKNTLEFIASKRSNLKRRFQQGVDISLQLVKTEGVVNFPK